VLKEQKLVRLKKIEDSSKQKREDKESEMATHPLDTEVTDSQK
jgi:hypothetical protein